MKRVPDHDLELTHAPDVDPHWTSEFIIEARLRDLPGVQIGESLAEVNAHVVESGEDARVAFGDPRAYAVALAEAADPQRAELVGAVMPAVVQTAGMLGTLHALPEALAGDPLEVTVGMLVALGLLAVAFVILVRQATQVLRMVVDRPWLAIGLNSVFFAATIGALFIPGTLTWVPAWWVLGVGLALLVVGTVLGLSRSFRRLDEDPIAGPFDEDRKPRLTWLTWLNHLLAPIFTLVLGLVMTLL